MVRTRWRAPREIVALRALGLSLAQVARVLKRRCRRPRTGSGRASGDARRADPPARRHGGEGSRGCGTISPTARRRQPAIWRGWRADAERHVAFDLPWPWGGERFELRDIRPLNYITGPLGSGKTRLAMRLAEALPDAAFLGLERLADGGATARRGWMPTRRSSRASIGRWPGWSKMAPRRRTP